MKMGSVDVAIPCYQYGRFLRQCVASVLSQGIDRLRVHIIDNASTDDSAAVARALAEEDARVTFTVHARNLGPNASYNEAVDWAQSDYFLLLDADDLLAPGCLRRACAILDAEPEVAFSCGVEAMLIPDGTLEVPAYQRFNLAGTWHVVEGADFIAQFCRHPVNWVGAPTVVRRTSVQKKAGHYRASLPYTDDLEMWLRLALHGQVAITPEIQAIRRKHEARHGSAYERSYVRDFVEREAAFESFFAHEGRDYPDAEGLLRLARTRLGEHAYWVGAAKLARARGREGAELLGYSLGRRPIGAVLPPFAWPFRSQQAPARARLAPGHEG